jgi:hypothetical protein
MPPHRSVPTLVQRIEDPSDIFPLVIRWQFAGNLGLFLLPVATFRIFGPNR